LVLYLVLPSVSRSIFTTRLCRSFGYDDFDGTRRSYLVADGSIQCTGGDAEFARLQVTYSR
jgi:hypothetical protein